MSAASISTGAHAGASWYNRDVAAWMPSRGSADADILPDLDTLVARSRDIDRNNGVAKGGIQTIIDNVIGTGLRLQPRPDYEALGQDKAWSNAWSRKVRSLFQQYWWTTACHAGDSLTGDQLTTQTLRSQLLNGDALTLPLWLDRGDGFKTKLQTVEADRLSNPRFGMDSVTQRGGIALDTYGAPIAYSIRKTHPGDWLLGGQAGTFAQWEVIPRRTSFGRLRVIHTCSGQTRGKPLLSAVLAQFKNVDRYSNAELQAAVLNAMIAGIIETPMDQESIVDLFNNDADAYQRARKDQAVKFEAGSLMTLFPGDKMQPFIPQRPAAAFGNFIENMFRIIAVGCDMPYELLLKDFSKTSYASARSSMLEAWRSFHRRRDWMGTMWMDPIYALFLEEVVNDGRIEAPGFYENRAAYQMCRWIGPGRGWIDPLKEANAMEARINSNVSTLEIECAEQGYDWEDILEQRATEIARMKELGIVEIVTGRATVVPQDAPGAVDSVGPVTTPVATDTPA